jgi:hypothetical protein
MKAVSSSSERVEFVQQSLGEMVAKVVAIASSFSNLGELSATTSPQCSVEPTSEQAGTLRYLEAK